VNVVVSTVYLVLILYVRARGGKRTDQEAPARTGWLRSGLWALGGFTLILLGQTVISLLENAVLGAPSGDTGLASVVRKVPLFAVAMVMIGPLVEEFVFREALFGLLRTRWGFWPGALASAVIFAAIHQELRGFLVRVVMGLVLAFIYNRTNRLSVSWLAHALNNVLVLVATLLLV
jgi:membrane protease YdiL (CAAX protease family)